MFFNTSYLSFPQIKTITVITGLQNMVAYRHRLITSDHPCILHLEPGKSVLESSLAVLITNNIRLLLNKLYRSHDGSVNNKVVKHSLQDLCL
jgi:hypothetical protein